MKTTRRKFFGLTMGATVAGPSVAKNLASTSDETGYGINHGWAGRLNPNDAKYPGDVPTPIDPVSELKYHAKRLAELRERHKSEVLSGSIGEKRDRADAMIDSYRSVSPVNKIRIQRAAMRRIEIDQEISEIESCIEHWKKQLGPLALIVE